VLLKCTVGHSGEGQTSGTLLKCETGFSLVVLGAERLALRVKSANGKRFRMEVWLVVSYVKLPVSHTISAPLALKSGGRATQLCGHSLVERKGVS